MGQQATEITTPLLAQLLLPPSPSFDQKPIEMIQFFPGLRAEVTDADFFRRIRRFDFVNKYDRTCAYLPIGGRRHHHGATSAYQ
jgi:hypothetical protein